MFGLRGVVGSAALVAGCTAGTERLHLSELPPMDLFAGALRSFDGSLTVVMSSNDETICPTIDSAVTASVDGIALPLASAGRPYRGEEGPDCNPIIFYAVGLPRGPLGTETSTIQIEDATAVWTIEVDGLLAGDLTIVGDPSTDAQVTLHWPAASAAMEDWEPHATFSDTSGRGVTSWTCDTAVPARCDASIDSPATAFLPIFGMPDWTFRVGWNTSTSTHMDAPAAPIAGTLTIYGDRDGTNWDGTSAVRRCDGPSSCVTTLESITTVAATLF